MPIARNFHVRERHKQAPDGIAQLQRDLLGLPVRELVSELKWISSNPWNWPPGDLCWWIDLLDHLEMLLTLIASFGDGKTANVMLPPQDAEAASSILGFISYLLDNCSHSRLLNRVSAAVDLLKFANLEVLLAALDVLSKIDTCGDFCEALRLDGVVERLYRWCLLLPLQFETDPLRLLHYYTDGSETKPSELEGTSATEEPEGNDGDADDALEAQWLLQAQTDAPTRHLLIDLQGYALAVVGRHIEPADLEKHVLRFQPNLFLQWVALVDPAYAAVVPRPLKMLALHLFFVTCFRDRCEEIRQSVARRTGNLGILSYLPYFSALVETSVPKPAPTASAASGGASETSEASEASEANSKADGDAFDEEFAAHLFRAVACTLSEGLVSAGLAPMLLDFISMSHQLYPRAATAAVKLLNSLLIEANDTAHSLNDFEAASMLVDWVRDLRNGAIKANEHDSRDLLRALLSLACSLLVNKHSRAVFEFLNQSMLSECVQLVLHYRPSGSDSSDKLETVDLVDSSDKSQSDSPDSSESSASMAAHALMVMTRLVRRDNGAAATITERADASTMFDTCIALMQAEPRHCETVAQFVVAVGTSPHVREGGFDGLAQVMRVFKAIPRLALDGTDVHLSSLGYTLDVCFTRAGEPAEAANVIMAMLKEAVEVADEAYLDFDNFYACDHIHAYDAPNHLAVMVEQVLQLVARAVENAMIAVPLVKQLTGGEKWLIMLVTHQNLPYYFGYGRGDDVCYVFSSLFGSCRGVPHLQMALAKELLDATARQVHIYEQALAQQSTDEPLVASVRDSHTGAVVVLRQMCCLASLLRIVTTTLYSDESRLLKHTSPSWMDAAVKLLQNQGPMLTEFARNAINEQAYACVEVPVDLAVSTRAVVKPPRGYVCTDGADDVEYDDWFNCVQAEPKHRRALARRIRGARFSLWLSERSMVLFLLSVFNSTVIRDNYCHNSLRMCALAMPIILGVLKPGHYSNPLLGGQVTRSTVEQFAMWRQAKFVYRVFDHPFAAFWLPIKLFVQAGGIRQVVELLVRSLSMVTYDSLCIPRIIREGAEPLDMAAVAPQALAAVLTLLMAKLAAPERTSGTQGAVFSSQPQEYAFTIVPAQLQFEARAEIAAMVAKHGEVLFAKLSPQVFEVSLLPLIEKIVRVPWAGQAGESRQEPEAAALNVDAFYNVAEAVEVLKSILPHRPVQELEALFTRHGHRHIWDAAAALDVNVPFGPTVSPPAAPVKSEPGIFNAENAREYDVLALPNRIATLINETLRTRPEMGALMAQLYHALQTVPEAAKILDRQVLPRAKERAAQHGQGFSFVAGVLSREWRGAYTYTENKWFAVVERASQILATARQPNVPVDESEVAGAASVLETLITCRFGLFRTKWVVDANELELTKVVEGALVPDLLRFSPEVNVSLLRLALAGFAKSGELPAAAFGGGFVSRAVEVALAQRGSLVGKQLEILALMLMRCVVETTSTQYRLANKWLDGLLVPIARNADNPALARELDVIIDRDESWFDDNNRWLTFGNYMLGPAPPSEFGDEQSDPSAKMFLRRSLDKLVDYINRMAADINGCRAVAWSGDRDDRGDRQLKRGSEGVPALLAAYLLGKLEKLPWDGLVEAASQAHRASRERVKLFNLSQDASWAALKARANSIQFYVTALAESVAISERARLALLAPGLLPGNALDDLLSDRPSSEAQLPSELPGEIQLPQEPPAPLYSLVALLVYSDRPDPKKIPAHHVGETVAMSVLELLFSFSRLSSESPVCPKTLGLMTESARVVLRLVMNLLQHHFQIGRLPAEVTEVIRARADDAASRDALLYMLLRLVNLMAESANKHSEWAAVAPAPVATRLMVAMQLPQLATACMAKMDLRSPAAALARGQYELLMCHVATFDSRDYALLDNDEGIRTAAGSPASSSSESSDASDDEMVDDEILDDDMSAAEFVFQVQDIMDSDQMEQIVAEAVRDVSRGAGSGFGSGSELLSGSDSDEPEIDVLEGSPPSSDSDSTDASSSEMDQDDWEDEVFEDVSQTDDESSSDGSLDSIMSDVSDDEDDDDDDDRQTADDAAVDFWDFGMDDDDTNFMVTSHRQPFVSPALGLYDATADSRGHSHEEDDYESDPVPDLQTTTASDEWVSREYLPLANIATRPLAERFQSLALDDLPKLPRSTFEKDLAKHALGRLSAVDELPLLLQQLDDMQLRRTKPQDQPLYCLDEFPQSLRASQPPRMRYPVYGYRGGDGLLPRPKKETVDQYLLGCPVTGDNELARREQAQRFFGDRPELGAVMSDAPAATAFCEVLAPTGTSRRWAAMGTMFQLQAQSYETPSTVEPATKSWLRHLAVLAAAYAMAVGERPLTAPPAQIEELRGKVHAVAGAGLRMEFADYPTVETVLGSPTLRSHIDSLMPTYLRDQLGELPIRVQMQVLRPNVQEVVTEVFSGIDADVAAGVADVVASMMLVFDEDDDGLLAPLASLHDAYFHSQHLRWTDGPVLLAPPEGVDRWLRAPRRRYTPGVWNSVFTKQDLAGWLELVFVPFGPTDGVLELTPLVVQNPTVAYFLIQSLIELLDELRGGRRELLQAFANLLATAQGAVQGAAGPPQLPAAGSLRMITPWLVADQVLSLIEHLDSSHVFRRISVRKMGGRYLLEDLLQSLTNPRIVDNGRQLEQLLAVIELVAERLPRHLAESPESQVSGGDRASAKEKEKAKAKDPGQKAGPADPSSEQKGPGAGSEPGPAEVGRSDVGRAETDPVAGPSEAGSVASPVSSPADPAEPVVPFPVLATLVDVLAAPECSPAIFQNILVIMIHLSQLPGVSEFFDQQLVARAGEHRDRLVQQLALLRHGFTLERVAGFMAPGSDQVYLLRFVTMLSLHFSEAENANETTRKVRTAAIAKLLQRVDLPPLWADLDACLSSVDQVLPGTSNALLLPLIETLMVATQRGGSEETARACTEFAVKHREILNSLVRDSPGLLRGAFSVLARDARVLEYGNRRAFFDQEIDREIHASGYDHDEEIRIDVGRDTVFKDSFDELFSLNPHLLRAAELNIAFVGEQGIDEGGLTREWYTLLGKQIFDADYALFTPLTAARTVFHPNRLSRVNSHHLQYFEFVGRLLAKAIVDGQIMDAYFSRVVYKLLLGQPVGLEDMEVIDESYFRSLKWMLENDITDVIHESFSVVADNFGNREVVELVPGGAAIDVTEENKAEYVKRIVQYTLVDSVKEQTESLIKGFYSMLSRDKISLFDDKELEFLISGMPDIDIDDWRANTVYTNYGNNSPQIRWLWRAIESFDSEERARLLQFCTGTSKVPISGFAHLSSGRFTVEKEFGGADRLPSAHTCNNVLCLPEYKDYESLRAALIKALEMGSGSFALA